jgi:hypothetical protein
VIVNVILPVELFFQVAKGMYGVPSMGDMYDAFSCLFDSIRTSRLLGMDQTSLSCAIQVPVPRRSQDWFCFLLRKSVGWLVGWLVCGVCQKEKKKGRIENRSEVKIQS